MLVLSRKEGQWIEVTHHSGDLLRIRVYNLREGNPPCVDLAFDDDARNFAIHRPERKPPTEPDPARDAGVPAVPRRYPPPGVMPLVLTPEMHGCPPPVRTFPPA